ncbi:MAG: hypothetical protein D3911_13385 [Candidatus Electrothrix sp. AW3_4]|nr:hypothetical protein [Candidatus Electrothrix gigas]
MGQAANILWTTTETLRKWESTGELLPAKKNAQATSDDPETANKEREAFSKHLGNFISFSLYFFLSFTLRIFVI